MKKIALTLALIAPTAAFATLTPIEEIERVAFTVEDTVASGPALPMINSQDAVACGIAIDPLPEVLTLHLGDEAGALMAFCIDQ